MARGGSGWVMDDLVLSSSVQGLVERCRSGDPLSADWLDSIWIEPNAAVFGSRVHGKCGNERNYGRRR